jgi:membrane-associated protease RseP (regulator of RpoE activity)
MRTFAVTILCASACSGVFGAPVVETADMFGVSLIDAGHFKWGKLATRKGALVVNVEEGSLAAVTGVKVGDIIISVNDQKTDDLDALKDALVVGLKARAHGAVPVPVVVRREEETVTVRIPPARKAGQPVDTGRSQAAERDADDNSHSKRKREYVPKEHAKIHSRGGYQRGKSFRHYHGFRRNPDCYKRR